MADVTIRQTERNEKRLRLSAIITFVMFLSQLVGGFVTNSLAIMSDSWHLLSDLFALLLSWYAVNQTMKPADERHTFGYHRFGSISAFVNGLTLIGISLFICYEAARRFLHPVEVHSVGMLWLAGIGLIGTFVIVVLLKEGEANINVKSALIHFLGDVFSYLGILLGGIVISATGWTFVDPLLSAVFAAIILKNAWAVTKEAGRILLEAVPSRVSLERVKVRLSQEPEVLTVIDLHIWALSNEHLSLSAHIQVPDMDMEAATNLLHRLKRILLDEFQIAHTTIQLQTEAMYHNDLIGERIAKVH